MLNKLFLIIFLFILPLLTFIYKNIKLMEINIISNLILINFVFFISLLIISFIFKKLLKKDSYFNYLIFFLLSYNTLFYFENIKIYFLNYTSLASYISLLVILGFILIIYKNFKIKIFNNFIKIYFFLSNIILITLITFSIINKNDFKNDKVKSEILDNKKIFESSYAKPNIYLVIMDGMTSLKYANEFLKIDYTFHKNFLLKNNFDYYDTFSNYNTTYLTMATILQMDYVVKPNDDRYFDRNNFWPYLLGKKEKKPNLIKILERNNFDFKWYGNITASCKNYANNKNYCSEDEINSTFYVFNSFYSNTPIITILRKFFPKIMLSYYGDKVDAINNFINSKKIYDNSFTLIHHLSPHPPYIYNPDCSIKKKLRSSVTTLDSDGYKDAYLCALKKIEDLIHYLNKFDPGAHILITADHGWNINEKHSNNKIEKIREKAKIYSSIKVNEACQIHKPQNFDTVNSIRYLVGCSFNLKPKFLESEIFYGFQEEDKENFGKVYKLEKIFN